MFWLIFTEVEKLHTGEEPLVSPAGLLLKNLQSCFDRERRYVGVDRLRSLNAGGAP